MEVELMECNRVYVEQKKDVKPNLKAKKHAKKKI